MAELLGPILLVEQTPSSQLLYRNLLNSAGIAVQIAENGTEALRMFHLLRPKVVMMELALSDRDGQALLTEMIAVDPALCVVVMSA